MLHLAQVTKNIISQKLELQLLAYQKSEYQWAFCEDQNRFIPLLADIDFDEKSLILVDLDERDNILRFRDLKEWIFSLIRQYLIKGNITPEFIAEEQERIEKWRQELTAQSQDLTRIRLEIETKREELQQLEESLNWEKEKLKTQIREQ